MDDRDERQSNYKQKVYLIRDGFRGLHDSVHGVLHQHRASFHWEGIWNGRHCAELGDGRLPLGSLCLPNPIREDCGYLWEKEGFYVGLYHLYFFLRSLRDVFLCLFLHCLKIPPGDRGFNDLQHRCGNSHVYISC